MKAANIDDKVLISQWRKGDCDALEKLILKYQGRLYNVVLKICGNADDAAELTQETFVRAITAIDRFEGRSSFYTWLFRIAVNLTLSFCKRRVKLGLRSLEAELGGDNDQAGRMLKEILVDQNSPDPMVIAENRQLCDLVLKVLMKLDKGHRAVVVLRDIEGMSYAQIAEALDIELGTVKSRLSRARSNLRETLEAFL